MTKNKRLCSCKPATVRDFLTMFFPYTMLKFRTLLKEIKHIKSTILSFSQSPKIMLEKKRVIDQQINILIETWYIRTTFSSNSNTIYTSFFPVYSLVFFYHITYYISNLSFISLSFYVWAEIEWRRKYKNFKKSKYFTSISIKKTFSLEGLPKF